MLDLTPPAYKVHAIFDSEDADVESRVRIDSRDRVTEVFWGDHAHIKSRLSLGIVHSRVIHNALSRGKAVQFQNWRVSLPVR